MKNMFFNLLVNFLTVDNICKLIGYGLGKLLQWARKKDCWDKLKLIVNKLQGWLAVIDQVIEDDNLSAEEEAQIIEALKNTKAMTKVEEVLTSTVTKIESEAAQ